MALLALMERKRVVSSAKRRGRISESTENRSLVLSLASLEFAHYGCEATGQIAEQARYGFEHHDSDPDPLSRELMKLKVAELPDALRKHVLLR